MANREPYHFKTRLVELSYVDTGKKQGPRSSLTFLIEDFDHVARRMNLETWQQPMVKRKHLNREHSALLELFQFFIGNTDYSILVGAKGETCCHNARLLVGEGAPNGVIPVPYDFDSSGFVDAPYATPADRYPILDVRQRYFTGTCKEAAHFENAITTFVRHRDDINQLLNESSVISDASRSKALRYTDKFFKLVSNPKSVEKKILSRCRGTIVSD